MSISVPRLDVGGGDGGGDRILIAMTATNRAAFQPALLESINMAMFLLMKWMTLPSACFANCANLGCHIRRTHAMQITDFCQNFLAFNDEFG